MSINSRLLPRAVAAAISLAALTTAPALAAPATQTPPAAAPTISASDNNRTSEVHGKWRFVRDIGPAGNWRETKGTQLVATTRGSSWIEVRGTDSWCYDMKTKQERSPKTRDGIVRCG